ncbi:MAG TPA: delta-60 repeat domain-containing protein [Solirubrobacterales bacterium]|nr:delta-60 repeat domain-containing protein [Solirubrobacterales bacterium]
MAAALALGAPAAAGASVGNFGMAVQPDGRIVVAGGAGLAPEGGEEFGAVARYLPNGKLDPSFGGGDGIVLARALKPFTAVAPYRDGRIVLTAPIGEVVRLLPDGRFDGNFGVRGRKAAGASSSWFPRTVAVSAVGGIYTGGMSGYPQDTGEHWYGWLYRVAGSGLTGIQVGGFTGGESDEPKTFLNDIVLAGGGQVYGAGTIAERRADAKTHAVLARLRPATMGPFGTPDGPDPSFGGGLVTSNFLPASPLPEAANALARYRSKLLIAGEANGDLLLSRYFENGAQDNGFGRRGFWTVTVGRSSSDVANAVAVDRKGAIFAAGASTHRCGAIECTSLLLARFGKDGHPARGFGHDGIVTPPLGSGAAGAPAFEAAYDLALRPKGKVLVGGLVGGPSSTRFFLRRYDRDGTPDRSFGRRGRVTTLPIAVPPR